jgi:FkbM family methyltransferase
VLGLRGRVLRAWRRSRHRRVLRRMAGPKLLTRFAEVYPNAFFVEVGSNDGEQHDHLRPLILAYQWRGIMVEPVPYVFERLRRNYGSFSRINLENAAIADHDGTLPFYHLAQPDEADVGSLPSWHDAIGSFSRDAVLAHERSIPDIADRIVEIEVPALTYASLRRKHGADHVDLLLIDTEGYDWEIIKRLDLDVDRPRLIVYEHFHLSPDDRRECQEHLAARGYEILEEGFDTFCLYPAPDDAVLRLWRGLKPAVAGVSVHDEPAAGGSPSA